jgi:hypothetical protein
MKKILTILLSVFLIFSAGSVFAKCGDEFKSTDGSVVDADLNTALNDCTPDGAITTKTSVPL